jgi:transcriptional regulator with XRE-family HTH domain
MDRDWRSVFGAGIRELRQRLGAKQLWLACATGCTDATVSLWEAGKRVPHPATLRRLVAVLARAGATPNELAALERSWRAATTPARSDVFSQLLR